MFYDRAMARGPGASWRRPLASFRREKFVPKGGPDGGDGGDGGDVVLLARRHARPRARSASAGTFRRAVAARRGRRQDGRARRGRHRPGPGRHAGLRAPAASAIADLAHAGARAVMARGGRGGRGNRPFTTAARQAPRTAQVGHEGDIGRWSCGSRWVSDAALLGFPNAGKSSLCGASRTHARRSPTTRSRRSRPSSARWRSTTARQLTVADVPGLLEGASQGVGLGHEFLAHLERARALLHVVAIDPAADDALADAGARFATIHRELRAARRRARRAAAARRAQQARPAAADDGDALVAAFGEAVASGDDAADATVLRDETARRSCSGSRARRAGGAPSCAARCSRRWAPIAARRARRRRRGELADYLVYRPPARARVWRILRDDGMLRVAGREVEAAGRAASTSRPRRRARARRELDRLGLSEALRHAGASRATRSPSATSASSSAPPARPSRSATTDRRRRDW